MKKILVFYPNPDQKGGVTGYYNSIFKHYKSDSFILEHFVVGRRPGKDSNVYWLCTTLYDFTRLFIKLLNKDYILVHLNPSLDPIGVLRDAIFLLVARLYSRKIVVFWRGWHKDFEAFIESNRVLLRIFTNIFDKANACIVLSNSFKKKLEEWKVCKKIFVETTTVDDSLLEGFSLDTKVNEVKGAARLQILFFSRLEIAKGIIETIDAFAALDHVDREITLVIAGDGADYNLVEQHVNECGDDRIKMVGYVRGKEKIRILESSHLMCLPTRGEGLPNAILEAMAFGMPIITRPVGGIPDIFKEGENGYYVRSLDEASLSNLLKNVISDKEGMARMAVNNYNFARERFLASIVAKRIDSIYKKVASE